MKRIKSILVVFVLFMGFSMQVIAAERNSGTIANCDLGISSSSTGIRVSCSTVATSQADEIGVKDVVLQEKVNGSWKNINISGGSEKNSSSYGGSVVYTGAVRGRTYRASCTHYAKFGSTTKTAKSSTGEMVFN